MVLGFYVAQNTCPLPAPMPRLRAGHSRRSQVLALYVSKSWNTHGTVALCGHEWFFFVFSWCPKTSKPKGIPLGLGKQPTEKSKTACLGFTSPRKCSQPHCTGSAGAHEQHPDDEPVAAARRRKTQALSKVFLVVRLKRPSSFCFSRSAWCLPFGCKLARCKFVPKRQALTHPWKAEKRPHF